MLKRMIAKKIIAVIMVCCTLICVRPANAFVWPTLDMAQISSFVTSITNGITTITMPESARDIGSYAFASCDELREFIVYSNLTYYADNAFDGCYYINYDAVTIKVEDSSASLLIVIVAVLAVIGVIGYVVYQKKQKKAEKEILEKIAKREALEVAKAE